jgi:hypothetical protein
MSASFAAATSGSPALPDRTQRRQRPSRTRTLLTGYPSLSEARTLVMRPVVAPSLVVQSSTGRAGDAAPAHAHAQPHGAGPSSARLRAALDEMSLVLPIAPSREAARLAAFESARRLVARDAMELQSGIAVASDETLDCVLDALRSAEGLDDRALAPAVAAVPGPRASLPEPGSARGRHATSVMQVMAVPSVSPSIPPSASRPRLLRTLRIPPALPASVLSPSPLARRAPSHAPRRASVRSRGRGATFGLLAALGVVAGAAVAWLVIGTPQVLARSAPPATELTAAAR